MYLVNEDNYFFNLSNNLETIIEENIFFQIILIA